MARLALPSIPVRYNKRTTEKPISMLNGDYLPQLKTIKSSEMAPTVIGHNASIANQTRRLLKQWYGEQQHTIDKLRNSQRIIYRQLARIHLERRKLKRAMVHYRQNEARVESDRDKERFEREKELAKISAEIEKVKNINRKRIHNLEDKESKQAQTDKGQISSQKDAPIETKQYVVTDIITYSSKVVEIDKKSAAAKLRSKLSQQSSKNEGVTPSTSNPSLPDIEPITRFRSKSFIRQPSGILTDIPEDGELPSNTKVENFIQTGTILPEVDASNRKNYSTQEHHEVKESTTFLKHQNESPQKKKVSIDPNETVVIQEKPRKKKLSQVKKNRLRVRQKELESQELLKEPFSYYRLSADGNITQVPNAPPKFNTAEPSNRHIYDSKKRLDAEKASYVKCMNNLSKYTAEIMHEEVKLSDAFDQPKKKDDDEEKELKPLKVGAQEWMQVFIRHDLPGDVDPSSFEAMQFARYLRDDQEDEFIDPDKVFK